MRVSVRRKLLSARKILVADNDNAVRQSVTGALKQAGYGVATAENARQALHQLQQKEFDLTFLDLWTNPEDSSI